MSESVKRHQALEEQVLLIAPSFGWWRGYYQLPRTKTQTMLDGDVMDQRTVTTPRVRLLTDEYPVDRDGMPWKKRFQTLETRKTAVAERWSVPFPISGVRIVPKKVAVEFLREIRDIETDLHAAVDEFVQDYDGIMEQIRNNVDQRLVEAAAARASFPKSAAQMRTKFYIDIVPVEIVGIGDDANVASRTLTLEELEDHQQFVREATQRKIEEAISSVIEAPRRQLAGAVAGLHDVIQRNGKVSAKSFRPVYEAMRKIRMFEFACNQQLLAEIDRLEQRMNITVPNTLDATTAATSGFSAALETLMREVEDAEQIAQDYERFGSRNLRSIAI